MRVAVLILVLLLVSLQFRLWVGKGSLAEVHNLNQEIVRQQQTLEEMRERNLELQAEVRDLQSRREWIEERAREDLGMIGRDEIFYQLIEPVAGVVRYEP